VEVLVGHDPEAAGELRGAEGRAVGVECPGRDRVLQELHGTIAKAEIRTAGVEAGRSIDEAASLCRLATRVVLRLLLDVDRVELGEGGVAVVARDPPVPAIEGAVGLVQQPVGVLAEGDRVARTIGDRGDLDRSPARAGKGEGMIAAGYNRPVVLIEARCSIGGKLARLA